MSYDIECAGRKGWRTNTYARNPCSTRSLCSLAGIFPEPEHDPVIQIASMIIRQGEKDEFIKTVFTLGTCASIAGVEVIECKTEHELLEVTLLFSIGTRLDSSDCFVAEMGRFST